MFENAKIIKCHVFAGKNMTFLLGEGRGGSEAAADGDGEV